LASTTTKDRPANTTDDRFVIRPTKTITDAAVKAAEAALPVVGRTEADAEAGRKLAVRCITEAVTAGEEAALSTAEDRR
jgi:hypothetical protein